VVTADFDYSKLDLPGSIARIRLDSTVTRVENDGDPKSSKAVRVTYVRDGQSFQVVAAGCVLACNNSIIPYLCPELPEPQRKALSRQIKIPILYTSVALGNWQAWKKLGIGGVLAPGSYHINTSLDFPVSLGDYKYSSGPDQPVIVHMERFPHRSNSGLSPHEQYRLGSHELYTTSFETIERNVRLQLAGMLGAGGFDPAQDILGITVNRWAHGYANWYNPLFDTVYEDDDDERYPHMQARKPFGRITIANADSAASAMLEAAVEQGYRAVSELG
jgi:spermidine dehydrogenase